MTWRGGLTSGAADRTVEWVARSHPRTPGPLRRLRSTQVAHAALPEGMRDAVDEFARHLSLQRGRSPHTVRAYVADVVSLLDHAGRLGLRSPSGLTIAVLRSWLARLRTTGAARASLARRAAAARTFTAWAHHEGRLAHDVASALASPKAYHQLPRVLRAEQPTALVTAPTNPTALLPLPQSPD